MPKKRNNLLQAVLSDAELAKLEALQSKTGLNKAQVIRSLLLNCDINITVQTINWLAKA